MRGSRGVQLCQRFCSWGGRDGGRSQIPSKHAYMGPIWASYMGPIWGVRPGFAWIPYGLAHMRVAEMGPIWVPYNSPIKKKK